MTENRDLDPFTAEQLLSGAPVDGEVGPLADLLAAATADARADELTGEAVAMAAFRDAAGVQPGAGSVGHRPAGRFLGVKIAIAVAAVASAGVAGAAAAGLVGGGDGGESPAPQAVPSITASVKSSAHTSSPTPTAQPDRKAGGNETPEHSTSRPTATRTRPTPRSTPSSPKPTATPTTPRVTRPSEQVLSMCRAYLFFSQYSGTYGGRYWPRDTDGGSSRADRMLDQPYFQPMVEAAGGKSKVPAYCKRIVSEDRDGSGNRAPQIAAPPSPSARPSGRPTTDPTSRPTASQTGTATTALPPPRGR